MLSIEFPTIAEAAKLIKSGKLSPVELTEMMLAKIATIDDRLHAFITVTSDIARRQAKQAEEEIRRGNYRGPLHGIPFGLKDLYYTQGVRTTGHSRIAMNHVPAVDATVTKKLQEAGAVLMGKLATYEFAHGGPSLDLPWPPASNPWDLSCFTGGSSSGSAAAVAAGLVCGALGTDTGGSIRTPSSYCGVVGLKPTYGLVSRYGVIPNSFSLDHCGPLTWTVEDSALMLGTIAGHDPRDPTSVRHVVPDYAAALTNDIRGLRIGVVEHLWKEDVPAGDELRCAMQEAVDVLGRLGANIEVARIRPAQEYYDAKVIISESEAFCVQHRNLINRLDDFGAEHLGRVLAGCLFQAPDYVRAQRQRRRLLNDMLPLYQKYDVLVTAGMGPAPLVSTYRNMGAQDKWRKASVTTVFDVLAGPALMLCNGYSRQGLPMGMQIVGRPFDETSVFRVAHAYESATPWRSRRPTLSGEPPPSKLPPADKVPAAEGCTEDMKHTVRVLLECAGVKVTQPALEQVYAAAPYAFAMARRMPFHEWEEEPMNIFTFPENQKAISTN